LITVHPIDRVLSALDKLTDSNPELVNVVDFYEELLPILFEARPALSGLALNPESAQVKLKEGVPLLWGEFSSPETIGTEPNIELFMTLCRLAGEAGNDDGERLLRAVLDGNLDLRDALVKTLVLDRAALTDLARSATIDLPLLETVSGYTLTPITWAYAAAFGQALDFAEWHRGYCPVCGAWPILNELRGRDKMRYLRCGRCGTGWRFNRLRCLWCDNATQKELAFLFDSDQPTWRIDVCNYCLGYIKTKTTFDPLDADMLLVYDLETMSLDGMATNEGYKRPYKQPLASGD
jgi:FdhE protein